MTITDRAPEETARAQSRAWPLWGIAAGILGAVATVFTAQPGGTNVSESVVGRISASSYHVGGALGYVTVALLLVLAACWRATITRLSIHDAAARLVPDGLTASAAGLTLGYGWKLAMAMYLPGGINSGSFGANGKFVYYMLNDFGTFLGWLGVVVAAGAVAWLGLRSRLLSVWLAVVSLIPPLVVLVMGLVVGIAGFQGIVAPIWLIVAFAGLALGKHRITGTR
jgi:hypothetical protein